MRPAVDVLPVPGAESGPLQPAVSAAAHVRLSERRGQPRSEGTASHGPLRYRGESARVAEFGELDGQEDARTVCFSQYYRIAKTQIIIIISCLCLVCNAAPSDRRVSRRRRCCWASITWRWWTSGASREPSPSGCPHSSNSPSTTWYVLDGTASVGSQQSGSMISAVPWSTGDKRPLLWSQEGLALFLEALCANIPSIVCI